LLDWAVQFLDRTGHLGIVLLMLAENLFPPIPSELVMPVAGFAAARGELGLVGVVLAGTAGSMAGAFFWYGIGRWVGCGRLKRWAARHGRWLTLAPHEIDGAAAWFRRHAARAVLIGRLVPGVRTLISVPAGFAEMPLAQFTAYTALGTAVWTTLLAVAGYFLGEQHHKVAAYIDPVAHTILVLLLLGYLYRVATFGRRLPS
jgi:membrane protein DedA with SNARE-associated domain